MRSRAGLRVTQILDSATGILYPDAEEDFPLDPADWATEKLRDTRGPHWDGGEIAFDTHGLPYVLDLVIVGGTLYRIQVHRDDLERMLTTGPSKKRAGRPPGGGYWESDEIIVEKMRDGLDSGRFRSANEAALYFADEAEGENTKPESKAKRLANRLKLSEKSDRN